MQISRDDCTLHLSEHHGDCSPGAAIRIETTALDDLLAELRAHDYKYAKPDIEQAPWGERSWSGKRSVRKQAHVLRGAQMAPVSVR